MGIDGISASLSGLKAAATRLNNTAHNIANVQTEGVERLRTDFAERRDGGVDATTRSEPAPGGIDLAQEAVERRSGALQFDVAARTLRKLADIEDSVLDILA